MRNKKCIGETPSVPNFSRASVTGRLAEALFGAEACGLDFRFADCAAGRRGIGARAKYADTKEKICDGDHAAYRCDELFVVSCAGTTEFIRGTAARNADTTWLLDAVGWRG
jgi:hypothetical protein